MRKYVIGTIFGFLLATAVGANAQGVTNMIGSVIDGAFNVKVNGVQLADQAIVVQGTSYLPVRAFGDAAGYDIKFSPDLGIELTQKTVSTTTPISTPVVTAQPTDTSVPAGPTMTVQDKINELNKKLSDDKNSLETNKALKKANEDSLATPNIPKSEVQKVINELSTGIAEIEARITNYETQIANLQK